MAVASSAPEIQILLSSELLKRFLAGRLALSPPIPADPENATLITDIVVDEVVALRGDDIIATVTGLQAGGAGSVLEGLGNTFGFTTTDQVYRAFRDGAVGKTFDVPTVFLLVSGSARFFSADTLRNLGDSSKIPVTNFERTGTYDGSTVFPALLFSVRVIRTTQPTTIQAIRFQLEAVFIPVGALTQDQIAQAAALRALVPPFDLPFDVFQPYLSKIQADATVLNIGVAANRWADAVTPSSLGLRVGIDIRGPLDVDGWTQFHTVDATFDADIGLSSADLSIIVQGAFMAYVLQTRTDGLNLPSKGDVHFDSPVVSIDQGEIDISVHAHDGDIPLGDAHITLSAVAAQRVIPQTTLLESYLDIRACGSFDEDLGGAFLIWFMSTWCVTVIGAAIGGGVGALVGAIIGTFAGIALDETADQLAGDEVRDKLGKADANTLGIDSLEFGAIGGDGCRAGSVPASINLSGVGELLLVDSALDPTAVGLAWNMRDANPPPAAHLSVHLGPAWGYSFQICGGGGDRDPNRGLILKNDGGRSLTIWWASQDVSFGDSEPAVLASAPDVCGTEAGVSITLAPGAAVHVVITARITDNTAYDQDQPPPLHYRVISTAGAFEWDLNTPQPARSEPQAEFDRQSELSSLLCQLLHERMAPQRWWEIPFVDPVPFDRGDLVFERFDVMFGQPGAETRLIGLDAAGRALAESRVSGGALGLSFADQRGGADAHTMPQLSLQLLQGSGPLGLSAGQASSTARMVRGRVAYPDSLQRSLYWQARRFKLNTPIIGIAPSSRAWTHYAAHQRRVQMSLTAAR